MKFPPSGCKGGVACTRPGGDAGGSAMPFFGVSASGPSSMVSGEMAAGVGEWKYVVARHHELRDAFRARASFSWRRLPTLLAARIAAWGAGVGGTDGPLVEPATEPAITDRHLFEFEPSETEENIAEETDSDSVGESGIDSFSERQEAEAAYMLSGRLLLGGSESGKAVM